MGHDAGITINSAVSHSVWTGVLGTQSDEAIQWVFRADFLRQIRSNKKSKIIINSKIDLRTLPFLLFTVNIALGSSRACDARLAYIGTSATSRKFPSKQSGSTKANHLSTLPIHALSASSSPPSLNNTITIILLTLNSRFQFPQSSHSPPHHQLQPPNRKDESRSVATDALFPPLLSPKKKQETPSCLPFGTSKGIREEFLSH